jgi:hypothetical protein
MERIELYRIDTPEIKILMELYFNEKRQLIFDGCDIGKKVEEIWGDSDYEYYYTIEPAQVEELYPVLGIINAERYALLVELKNRFGGNSAYSKFGHFMTENNIKFEAFTWR